MSMLMWAWSEVRSAAMSRVGTRQAAAATLGLATALSAQLATSRAARIQVCRKQDASCRADEDASLTEPFCRTPAFTR